MPALTVNKVSHWFGDNKVLYDIDLKIGKGQIVALVGPSGCGKSTLLRAVLGTHPPNAGKICAGEEEITKPSRDIGIVYQDYALYEHMTVLENVAFGLDMDAWTMPGAFFNKYSVSLGSFRGIPYPQIVPGEYSIQRKEYEAKSLALLQKVGLGQHVNKYPADLSGGMRQRVAIAQALVMEPKILLLDEPFGALDEATREELQVMLLHLYEENEQAKEKGEEPPYTIMIVTHELTEALYVSDRVLGLSQHWDGGSNGATIVYDKPAPVFRPHDTKELSIFHEQLEEIRGVVLEADELENHKEFVTFWEDHAKHTEQENEIALQDGGNA